MRRSGPFAPRAEPEEEAAASATTDSTAATTIHRFFGRAGETGETCVSMDLEVAGGVVEVPIPSFRA